MFTNTSHSAIHIPPIVTQLKALITERTLCYKLGNLTSRVLSPDAIQEIASIENIRAYINSSPISGWLEKDREELILVLSSHARRLFVLTVAKDHGAMFLYYTVVINKYRDPDADPVDPLARDRQYLVNQDTQVVADDTKAKERAIEEQTLVSAFKIEYMQFHRRILPFALPIEEVGENTAHMALSHVVAHAPEVAWDVKIGKEFLEGDVF